MDPVGIALEALRGSGLNLVGSCSIDAYDRRAPRGHRSEDLMPRARGVVVVGSGGGELWNVFRAATRADPSIWSREHPLDSFVASALDRVDQAFGAARIGSRRFEPLAHDPTAPDFRALGELAALGSMGPFGLLIHVSYGPWWALRGAWLLDVECPPTREHQAPCAGCPAPCLGSARGGEGVLLATPNVRSRCVVGQEFRYSDEQIAYHYDREATLRRMRGDDADAPDDLPEGTLPEGIPAPLTKK
jgi:hypothetical protein